MSRYSALLAALSVFALSACGTANTSDSGDPISDTTGPSVQKVTPSSGVQVSQDLQQIVVTFNEPVDAATLALADSISITPSVDFSVALDATDSKQVIITLNSSLTIDTTYKVSIGTALTDAAGNNIPNVISLSYHTPKPYTVGGTVTGLNGTLVLKELKYAGEHPELDDEGNVLVDDNNNPLLPPAPTVTITADGNFTFTSAYFPSDTFEVAIDSATLDEGSCAVESAAGTVGTQNVTSVKIICDRVEPVNGIDAGWNKYEFKSAVYKNGDPTQLVHAGELRQLKLTQVTSCDGLTISDELDVLHWACGVDAETGDVIAHSFSLKPEKGLSDLIDFSKLAWKKNKINVYDQNGIKVDGSNDAIWWDNKIVDIAGLSTGLTSGPVYIANSNPIKAVRLTDDLVTFAINPDIVLSAPTPLSQADNAAIIITGRFAWIEGKIDAANVDYGITIYGQSNTTYTFGTTLRNIVVKNAKNSGIRINYHLPRSLHNIASYNNKVNGLFLAGKVVHDPSKTGYATVKLDRITTTSNGGDGLHIEALNYSISDVVSADNGGNGVTITGADNTLGSLGIYSNQGNGIALGGSNNTVTMAHVSFNDTGLAITENADANNIDGLSLILNNVGISGTGVNTTTSLTNLVQVHNISSEVIDVGTVIGIDTDLTHVYAGQADSDGGYTTYNPSQSSYSIYTIKFTTRLQDSLRAWGPADGTATPCSDATTCLIYDWTPVAGGPLAPAP